MVPCVVETATVVMVDCAVVASDAVSCKVVCVMVVLCKVVTSGVVGSVVI